MILCVDSVFTGRIRRIGVSTAMVVVVAVAMISKEMDAAIPYICIPRYAVRARAELIEEYTRQPASAWG